MCVCVCICWSPFTCLVTRVIFKFCEQIQTMQAAKKPGVVINLGSASGLYPMYGDPIYSCSKGLLLFAARFYPSINL